MFRSSARLDAELPLRDGRSPYSGWVGGWALQVWLLAQGNAMRGTCFQAAHLDFSGNAVHGRAYEPCLAESQILEKERLPAPEKGASDKALASPEENACRRLRWESSGKAPLFQEKTPDCA